ncbi:unnamed protein product [Candida parapsilosis]
MGKIRARVSKVCDFCKKRKVKCDLGNPCSTCVKYKRSPCVYSELLGNEDDVDEEPLRKYTTRQKSNDGIDERMNHHGSLFTPRSASLDGPAQANGAVSKPLTPDGTSIDMVHDELSFLKSKLQSLEQQLNTQPPLHKTSEVQDSMRSKSSMQQSSPSLHGPFTQTSDGRISAFSPSNPILSSVDPIDLFGFNPIESENEWINFTAGYNPILNREPVCRKHYGPLSWVSLLKIDNAVAAVWTQMEHLKKQYKVKVGTHFIPPGENATQAEKDFSEKAYKDDGEHDVKLFRETEVKAGPKRVVTQEQLNEKTKSLGLSFYKGGLDEELELVEKIRLVLPKQNVIWRLYTRFFTHLYVAIPLLDEVALKEQVERLIGPEDYQDVKVPVKVEKKLDFAYLGLLLIVIRFSYVSLFSHDSTINEINFQTNNPEPKAQQIKFLLNNPIDIDVIDVAQLCLNQFDMMRCANMAILQLAVMTRLYHLYAPELGDGVDGGNALIFNATLIQMAKSLGLHRDPELFPDAFKDPKQNNLARKIWYYILVLEFNNAMNEGTTVTASFDSFDTKPPVYVPGCENVQDAEMEKIACSCFPSFDYTYEPMSEMFSSVFKVRGEVNMVDLIRRMNFMESHFNEQYNDVPKLYTTAPRDVSNEAMPSILRLKIYFTCTFLIASMHFHIFNYYERKRNLNLAYFYIKKIVSMIVYDVMPCFVECIRHKKNAFKNAADLMASPSFITVAHKSLIVLFSFHLRLRYWIHDLQKRYDHSTRMRSYDPADEIYKGNFQKLVRLADLVDKCMSHFRDGVARLSQRYYYAWRVTKAQNFLKQSLNDKFFETYQPTFSPQPLNSQMLDQFEHLFEVSLSKVEQSRNQRKMEKRRASTTTTNEPRQQDCDNVSMEEELENNVNSFINGNVNLRNHDNSVSSTGSTTSDSEYKPNEQVDTIWLQMMNMKNNEDPFSRFNDPGTMNSMYGATPGFLSQMDGESGAGVAFSPGVLGGLSGTSFSAAGGSAGVGGTGGGVFNSFELNHGEMFENFPIDELFKDFL